MSWFVGRKHLDSRRKYLITQTHTERPKPDIDHIDTLYRDMLSSKRLERTHPKKRSDSVVEPDISTVQERTQCDCDLSSERDVFELIDAVTKLLRYTDLDVHSQRQLVSDLMTALGHILPKEKTTMDKSLTVSAILYQVDNITLPDDEPCILPLVRKIIEVIQL